MGPCHACPDHMTSPAWECAAAAPHQIRAAGVDSEQLASLANGSVRLPHTDRMPPLPQPVSGLGH